MTVSRLAGIAGIGVDRMGDRADEAADRNLLRLENLDTDLAPPPGVVAATQQAATLDAANSYLPFVGSDALRGTVARHVSALSGVTYDWRQSTLICAGGLNGMLNCLLALLEPGDEVVMADPIYIGLINRVRLAGGVPRFVPYRIVQDRWQFDRDAFAAALSPRTRVVLMMSPSMPTGAVLRAGDWDVICAACCAHDAWLLYDAAMERILFDGLAYHHPAAWPGMADRTVTVGAVSKEYRMIGWRIGWVVAPPALVNDIGLVAISNVVCPVGIAQAAAEVALNAPPEDLAAATAEWQRRRDVVVDELSGLPVIVPEGGWSLLLDCRPLGLTGEDLAERLLTRADIAATPMNGWGGPRSADFLRIVYANEPVARLAGLGRRLQAVLD
jgi:N-succinyldiaminopimelate aminotransferase